LPDSTARNTKISLRSWYSFAADIFGQNENPQSATRRGEAFGAAGVANPKFKWRKPTPRYTFGDG
jgi:hypothetical protein